MKYYEILPTHTETPRNTTRKIANLYIEFNYHFLTLQKKISLLLNRSVQIKQAEAFAVPQNIMFTYVKGDRKVIRIICLIICSKISEVQFSEQVQQGVSKYIRYKRTEFRVFIKSMSSSFIIQIKRRGVPQQLGWLCREFWTIDNIISCYRHLFKLCLTTACELCTSFFYFITSVQILTPVYLTLRLPKFVR